MLIESQNTELRGFITDLEFARIERSTVETKETTVEIPAIPQRKYNDQGESYVISESTIRKHTALQSTVTIKRGAGMTVCDFFYAESFFFGLKFIYFFIGDSSIHEPSHLVASHFG
jgi:hypothetical protein